MKLKEKVNLLGEFDAKVWAKEFIKTIKKHPKIATDFETMSGWFANSIMAGYDYAKREKSLPNEKELRNIIVKHTSEMLDNPDEFGIYPTTKFFNDVIQAISKRLK